MTVDFLEPQHFAELAHREIFAAARGIWEGGGRPDVVVVAEALRAEGSPVSRRALESYLTYRGDSFADHANIVRSTWVAREVVGLGGEIAGRASHEEPWSVLDYAEERINSLRPTGRTGPTRLLGASGNRLGSVRRVSSGFPAVDAYLGGLVGGRLITMASRPGVGKTTLAFDIASNVAALGGSVVAFSLEMSTDELTERLLCKQTSIPQYRFKSGLTPSDVDSLARSCLEIAKWSLFVDDTSGLSAYEITSRAKKIKHDSSGLDLVVIDYVQLVSPPKADSREQEVAAIVRAFKHLARDLGVPVLMLSQLSRQAEMRGGKPRMSDLRESGGIENDADQIIALWRDERQDDATVAHTNLSVIKNRHGSSGDLPRMALIRGLSKFE